MVDDWLSESVSDGAKSVIVLGSVDRLTISELSKEFSMGILLFSSKKETIGPLPEKVTFIDRKESASVIKEKLENFMLLDYDSPPTVKVSKSISDESTSEYNKILDLTISEIDSTMRARRTRSETGYLRQRQVFVNLAGYLTKRIPTEWNGLAQGSLAVVVGAGPSLDVTLPLLKSGIPKPIIVASDSSLTALRSANLNPDFVVSIDPQKTFESCSEEGYSPGIAVLSSQSHESWSKKWGKNCCYLSGRIITEDWLTEKGISKTDVIAINNAGLTALMVANFLNPSAILTLGMDLSGGGAGQERYAKNTNRADIQIFASHYHKIPGNFSDTVTTPFLSDWQETSAFCRKISENKTIINLNDRGAKLEGATLVHPDQVEELKNVLNQIIKPFNSEELALLNKRKSLRGLGLNQLLCQLTTICDSIWDTFPKQENENNAILLNFLRETLADHDKAKLLGDFAFSVMPIISPEKKPTLLELKGFSKEIETLIWKLEDAILECNPEDDFLSRFFTEKFN